MPWVIRTRQFDNLNDWRTLFVGNPTITGAQAVELAKSINKLVGWQTATVRWDATSPLERRR